MHMSFLVMARALSAFCRTAPVVSSSVLMVAMPAIAQDECATAPTVVAGVPMPFSTLTATASASTPLDTLCPNSSLGWRDVQPDVWFKFSPATGGIATFTTCSVSSYDTSMVLYRGECGSLTPIACNGDAFDPTGCQEFHAEIANFEVEGGATYYIRIGGFDNSVGTGTLNVSFCNIASWGSNAFGQCRVPATTHIFKSIVGGGDHAVGILADGTLVAWGAGQFGQTQVPQGVSSVASVAAGGAHSLARLENGTVLAWGRNASGQCNVPAGLADAIAVAAGANHSLALRANGSVLAWGSNGSGQSTPPAGLVGLTAIAGGDLHSIARRADGG
ncbi:MAG: hypothetical protein RL354_1678, partial [Planctomycetota bacterium]